MLEISDNGRTWLLTGPASGYAVHLTEGDELLHLHWGPRIALADAEALAVRPLPVYRPFESQLDGREEYPVEGGAAPSGASRRTRRRATTCGCASVTAGSSSRCTTACGTTSWNAG